MKPAYICFMNVDKKIIDLENKVSLLLERVEDLELVIKEYNDEFRVGLANENLISLREVKLTSALQKKTLAYPRGSLYLFGYF